MEKLTAADLYSLEEYHRLRAEFRSRVLEHKKSRQLGIGLSAMLYFEDRLTMQYQIQEMLRVERIFEAEAIEEELGAYNPLIPDGCNFKATFMIEVPDVAERRRVLKALTGIEDCVYVQVDDLEPVLAVADEDMERSSDEKTSAVHFLRFELAPPMRDALREGASLRFGSTHPAYRHEAIAGKSLRDSLLADLD